MSITDGAAPRKGRRQSSHTTRGTLPASGLNIGPLTLTPPFNLEVEQHALGAMLRDPDAAKDGASLLNEGDFYRSDHRTLFRTIRGMVGRQQEVDFINVHEEMRRQHELEDIGGSAFLRDVIESCPGAADFNKYVRVLRDLTGKRDAARIAEKIRNQALNGATAQDVISELQQDADELARRSIAFNQKRFHFLTVRDLMTRADPQYLVHKLLTVGGTSLLTAKHASYKSFLALDLALSVATGELWQGFEVKQGPVIYIAAEGAAGLKKRVIAWLHHKRCDEPGNFLILDMPFQVADTATRLAFIREVAELKPALIILDTLARCAVGLDENNAGDMGQFADAVGALARETGAHVMTVHHNNKGGEYRGSSAVPAAVDAHLSMERKGEAVTLKVEKQKDDEELPLLVFEVLPVPLPAMGGKSHSLVLRRIDAPNRSQFGLSEIETKVLAMLTETFSEITATASRWQTVAEEQNVSRASFYRCVNRLLKVGAAKKTGEGRNAYYEAVANWPDCLGLTVSDWSHETCDTES